MAMVLVTPLEVRVRCDRWSGNPQRLRIGGEELPVLAVERIRDETSAHPATSGPRTRFQVVIPTSRLLVTYEHRSRRWIVDGLDVDASDTPRAA